MSEENVRPEADDSEPNDKSLIAFERYVASVPPEDKAVVVPFPGTRAATYIFSQPEREIGSSSDALGGSIDELTGRIKGLENSLGDLSASVVRLKWGQGEQVASEIEAKIAPIRSDLEAMKSETIPQLRDVRSSLDKVAEFLKETSGFLTDAVSAKGRIQAVEGRVDAHEERLRHLEGRRDQAWTRGIAIGSALIALASLILLYVSLRS